MVTYLAAKHDVLSHSSITVWQRMRENSCHFISYLSPLNFCAICCDIQDRKWEKESGYRDILASDNSAADSENRPHIFTGPLL